MEHAPEGYVVATHSASSSLRQRLIWTLAAVGIVVLISVAAIVAYYMAKFAPTGPVAVAPADQSDRTATAHHSGTSAKINSNETTNSSASSDSVDENIAAVPAKLEPVPADGVNNSGVVLAAAWNSPKPAGDFHSAKFGYAVALSGTPWTRWENLADVVPDAEFGALLNDYGRLLVIPISLATLDPRPEALDHALLSRLGITYPSDSLTDFKTLKLDSAAGQSFRLTREIGGAENRYRIVIWRRGTCAYLVAAWIDRAAMANQAAPTPSTAKETQLQLRPRSSKSTSSSTPTLEKFSLDHDAHPAVPAR